MRICPRHWLLASLAATALHTAVLLALSQASAPAEPVVIRLGAAGAPEGRSGGQGDDDAGAPATARLTIDEVVPVVPALSALAPLQTPALKTAPVLKPTPASDLTLVKAVEPAANTPPQERRTEESPPHPRAKPPTAEGVPAVPARRQARQGARESAEPDRPPPPHRRHAATEIDRAGPAPSTAHRSDTQGSGSGRTGRGSGAGGLRAGPGDGTGDRGLANYYGRLAAWLHRHKRYPREARQRRLEGLVVVSFTIDRRGRLLSHRLVNSSGHRALDREVEAMLARASPLPAFPASLDRPRLTIRVPINFTLR